MIISNLNCAQSLNNAPFHLLNLDKEDYLGAVYQSQFQKNDRKKYKSLLKTIYRSPY